MTTFPRSPAQKVPHQVAETARQVNRAHARLDQVESTSSKQTSDTAANTTSVHAINTGSGGSTQENFLGSISEAAHVTETNAGGWTPGGALNGSGSVDMTRLTTWMNQVNTDIGNIISALRAAGLMA